MPTPRKRKEATSRAIKRVVERAKREMLWDVQNGTLPALVQRFNDLHDFADAFGYGGTDKTTFQKQVRERLNVWMKTGVLGRSVAEPSRALRAQRTLEYFKADLGKRGPINADTLRDLLHDTLHWLAQQAPPNDYPDPAETLSAAAHTAIVDFPEGRDALAAIEAATIKPILKPKRKSKAQGAAANPKRHRVTTK